MGDIEEPVPSLPPAAMEPPPPARRSALGRKASLVLGSSALGSLMGLVTMLVVSKYVDPAAWGLFAFAAAALGIVQLVADLGFGPAHIHFVGKGTDPSRALGVYVRVRLVLTAAVALLLAGGGYLWFTLLGQRITDATTVPIVLVVLGTQAVSLVRTVIVDTWIGQERFNRSEAIKSLDTFLVMAGLAVVGVAAWTSQGGWTPVGEVGASLAGALGMEPPWSVPRLGLAVATVYLVAKGVSLLAVVAWWLRHRVPVGPWDPDLARRYAGFAFPVALATGAALLVPYTDKVMLGILGTSEDTGQFDILLRLAGMGGIVATALAAPLLPRFSLLLRAGQQEQASRTLRRVERFLLLVAVPVAAVLATMPEQVLHVVARDAFLPGANAIRLLALAALVGTALMPTVTKVMGGGHARSAMLGTVVTVVTNALLNLWLIPSWGAGLGITGAAISALASALISAVYMRRVLKAKFGLPAWNPLFARMALAGLAPAAFCLAALRWMPAAAFARWWLMAFWAAGAFMVFLLAAAALRLVRPADVRAVWKVANPKALLRELRGRQD
jgi:O-antigen/teichoic acid export membrane protein